MKYKNPIIPGFYPDPSICRVDDDYFLVNSSFQYFPGVPIFHSRDLVNWKQIGHCLNTEEQLPLHKVKSSHGIFAPTIRYNNGRFYMVTTNCSMLGNFYVYTDDPYGKWSNPITVKQTGIDPSLFFEDDGKVFLASTGDNGIQQSEIDIETGKLLTEPKLIWEGTGGRFPEGPHLYKINSMYYLMIAEGGTEYGHMETIARSNNPYGPFTPCPFNPILSHRNHAGQQIQSTGHADLIQTKTGEWFLIFLGTRPNGYPPCHHLGRETFLAPVKWSDNGWPVVYNHGKIDIEIEFGNIKSKQTSLDFIRDDFDNDKLELYWNFLRNPHNDTWSLKNRPGWLALYGSHITLNDIDSPAFIARRQQHFDFSIQSLMEFSPKINGEEAGLTIYMNEDHHYEIGVALIDNVSYVFIKKKIGDLSVITTKQKVNSNTIFLKIDGDINNYKFYYSLNNSSFVLLDSGKTRYLSTEVAGGFTGMYLGMYATGNGKNSSTQAFFDWFEYKVNPPEL